MTVRKQKQLSGQWDCLRHWVRPFSQFSWWILLIFLTQQWMPAEKRGKRKVLSTQTFFWLSCVLPKIQHKLIEEKIFKGINPEIEPWLNPGSREVTRWCTYLRTPDFPIISSENVSLVYDTLESRSSWYVESGGISQPPQKGFLGVSLIWANES